MASDTALKIDPVLKGELEDIKAFSGYHFLYVPPKNRTVRECLCFLLIGEALQKELRSRVLHLVP